MKQRSVQEMMDAIYNAPAPKMKTPLKIVENEDGVVEVYDADGKGVAMMGRATYEKLKNYKSYKF